MLVDIVMATYNGEKYIQKQIDSIIQQSFYNWRLIISDDGSNDRTLDILQQYCSKDDRILLVNTIKQGGVVKNFEKALSYSSADLIFLSDQDDIWPSERLEKMIEFAQKKDMTQPLMIFTDLNLIDENDNLISESFYMTNHIDPKENLDVRRLGWKSSIYGCSTCFNKNLLAKSLPFPDELPMHDHWLSILACQRDALHYYNYQSIGYRQHAGNVIGGSAKSALEKVKSVKKYVHNINKVSMKILFMQKELYKRNGKKFDKGEFILQNILPYCYKGSKRVYTIIFLVCSLK